MSEHITGVEGDTRRFPLGDEYATEKDLRR